MEVDPQAIINALSQQLGALQTENTILKMALQQQQAALAASDGAFAEEGTDKKKSAPKGAPDSE
jgi:hypothetical protein